MANQNLFSGSGDAQNFQSSLVGGGNDQHVQAFPGLIGGEHVLLGRQNECSGLPVDPMHDVIETFVNATNSSRRPSLILGGGLRDGGGLTLGPNELSSLPATAPHRAAAGGDGGVGGECPTNRNPLVPVPYSAPGGTNGRYIPPSSTSDMGMVRTYAYSKWLGMGIHAGVVPQRPFTPSYCAPLDCWVPDVVVDDHTTSVLDFLKAPVTLEEIRERITPMACDLRFTLFGKVKGVIRSARQVGEVLRIDQTTEFKVVDGPDYDRTKIVIAPAYARLTSVLTSEDLLKQEKTLGMVFEDVYTRIPRCTAAIANSSTLFKRGVNATRLVWRMAATVAMVIALDPLDAGKVQLRMRLGETPDIVNIYRYDTWEPMVSGHIPECDYLPWVAPRTLAADQDRILGQILTFFGMKGILIGNTSGANYAPIVWPTMQTVKILAGLTLMGSSCTILEVSPSLIYQACVAWCTRYANMSIFNEALQHCMIMQWCTLRGNCLTGFNAVSLALPVSDTRAFLLTPLQQNLDTIIALTPESSLFDGVRMFFESAVGAYVIGGVRDYFLNAYVDYAVNWDLLQQHDLPYFTSVLSAGLGANQVAFWFGLEKMLREVGFTNVKLGRYIKSMGFRGDCAAYGSWVKQKYIHRTDWADLVYWVEKVPEDTYVAGWVGAQPLNCNIIQPDNLIAFSEFSAQGIQHTLRSLTDIPDILGYYIVEHREMYHVSSFETQWQRINSKGRPMDGSLKSFELPNGSRVRAALKVNGLDVYHILTDPTHDRYHLTWYFGKVGCLRGRDINCLNGLSTEPRLVGARYTQLLDKSLGGAADAGSRDILKNFQNANQVTRKEQNYSPGWADGPGMPLTSIGIEQVAGGRGIYEPVQHCTWNNASVMDLSAAQMYLDETMQVREEQFEDMRKQSEIDAAWRDFFDKNGLKYAPNCVVPRIRELISFFSKSPSGQLYMKKLTEMLVTIGKFEFNPIQGRISVADINKMGVTVRTAFGIHLLEDVAPENRGRTVMALAACYECATGIISNIFESMAFRRFVDGLHIMAAHLAIDPELRRIPGEVFEYSQPPVVSELPSELVAASSFEQLADYIAGRHGVVGLGKGDNCAKADMTPKVKGVVDFVLRNAASWVVGSQSPQNFASENCGPIMLSFSVEERIALNLHLAPIVNIVSNQLQNMERNRKELAAFTPKACRQDILRRHGGNDDPNGGGGGLPRRASTHSMTLRSTPTKSGAGGGKTTTPAAKSGGQGQQRPIDCWEPTKEILNCWCFKNGMERYKQLVLVVNLTPCYAVKVLGGTWPRMHLDVFGCNCTSILTNENLRLWFDSLTVDKKAFFMLHHANVSAGPEHYQDFFDANYPIEVENFSFSEYERRDRMVSDILSEVKDSTPFEKCLSMLGKMVRSEYGNDCDYQTPFKNTVQPGGMPIQAKARHIKEVAPGLMDLVELLHNKSPDSYEFEVCGTVIGLLCVDFRFAFELFKMGIFALPLDQWHTVLGNFFTRAERSLIFGRVSGDIVSTMRKFLNLTIRRNDVPDIVNEGNNRVLTAYNKAWVGHDCDDWKLHGPPQARYLRALMQSSKDAWLRVVPTTMKRNGVCTVSEFWEKRAMFTPTGSSTLTSSPDVKKIIGEFDDRYGPIDRSNKKFTVECLDDDWLDNVMESTPYNRSRFLVKPEPKKKLRSLYASKDSEAFMCSFASQGQETQLSHIPGVLIKQSPADVVWWMSESANSEGRYWQSTDYSDYNAEHTMAELDILSRGRAWVWAEYARVQPKNGAHFQKAKADWWVAESYARSWIDWGRHQPDNVEDFTHIAAQVDEPGEKKTRWVSRCFNGLFSGHRDTARNNTLLHYCDILLMRDQMWHFGMSWDCDTFAVCGDDEDSRFLSPTDAFLHYNIIVAGGHQLNPQKQEAGNRHHCFLQVGWNGEARADKPIFSLLSTLASGNWYTQKGLWIQSVMQSCFANFYELYTRGAPKFLAQRLCVVFLNRLMYVSSKQCTGTIWEKNGKELEWWSFRNAMSLPPLFSEKQDDVTIQVRLPKFEAVPKPKREWPKKASEAIVRRFRKELEHIPPRYEKVFMERTQQETVGTVLKQWRQGEAKRWAAMNWPERTSKLVVKSFDDATICTTKPDDISMLLPLLSREAEIVNEATVAARIGVPFFIAKALGGVRNLGSFVTPEAWGRATDPDDYSFNLSDRGQELQQSIKAVVSTSRVPLYPWHINKNVSVSSKLLIICMANGAGKSHIIKTYGLGNDLDQIWFDTYGAFRPDYTASMPKSSFSKVAWSARGIVRSVLERGGVLFSQLEAEVIVQAARELNVELEGYWFDPGEELRRERLLRRDWRSEKVDERLARARRLYESAVDVGWKELKTISEVIGTVTRWEDARRFEGLARLPQEQTECLSYVFSRTEAVTRQLRNLEEFGPTPGELISVH